MVNKTPLRLVAMEENLPADDDRNAAPLEIMTENDAITRKVPESDVIAAAEDNLVKARSLPNLRILLPAVAVAIVVVVAIVVFATVGKSKSTGAPLGTTAASSSAPRPQVQPPATQAAPVLPSPSQATAATETIRLEITAAPAEAELSLDGNVLAGHRLRLEVPKDRGIHVLSASAPGYVPFNQQVSFSNDVVLTVSLRRGHTPAPHQAAKPRASQIEARPKSMVHPAAMQPGRVLEPGMNLEGPSPRPISKPIDERNPYKP